MKTSVKYKIKIFVIITVLFIRNSESIKAQAPNNKFPEIDRTPLQLSVKKMQSDLSILWSAIKEIHPGYNYFTPADSLQSAYVQAYSSINKPLYESEFISKLYPFICKLRCGHTQIKHSAGYKDPAGLNAKPLPFKVLVHNGRVFITAHQTESLHTGDEILSINDVTVDHIIGHGFDLYATDGYNKTFKELFLSEYDGFEDACNKYYHWKGPYKMQIRTKQGMVKELIIAEGKSNTIQAEPTSFDNDKDWKTAEITGPLKLRFFNNASTALFETKPFSYGDTITYKEVFKQIHDKEIKNLILDMRHNTGGDIRIAIQLLSYLADAPFTMIKDVKSRLSDPASGKYTRYFDKERINGFLQGYRITNKEGSWYHVETTPAMGTIYGLLPLAENDHFNGNLYVLIDGATFSSAALFTAALKSQRKATKFISRETAGGEEGCNGMVIQEFTLPNTKVLIDFPWMRVESVAHNPTHGRGILPDYEVNYDPLDVVINKDRDLEKVMELIREDGKNE